MKEKIILLCNSCPFQGETFLRGELSRVPEDCSVLLFPIMYNFEGQKIPYIAENVQVVTEGAHPAAIDKLLAAFGSISALFRHNELKAILRKRGVPRNILKALKFAYLSEGRARAAARWLRRNLPGEKYIFYSYWLYETAYAAAWLYKRFPGSRFVSRCHGFDLYEQRHEGGYLPYRRLLMRQADKICPIGEDGERYLNKLYRKRWLKKLHLSRLGTEDFGLSPLEREETPLLVSCSNLVEVKRVDRIIDALRGCSRRLRWIHFGDGPLMQELKERACTLPQNIDWKFAGRQPNLEVMAYYKNHSVDAFINVSESEGVPVSIMEALSFGIPVIATDVGGTGELVQNGENGYLLNAEFGSGALLSAIHVVLDADDADRLRMKKRARETWQDKCSARENYGRFYREVFNMEEH